MKLRQLLFLFILAYSGTTILVPKLQLGPAAMYPLEGILLCLFALLILSKKLKLVSSINASYLSFVGLSLVTFFVGMGDQGAVDFKTIVLLLKFFAFSAIMPLVYYSYDSIELKHIKFVLYCQLAFVIVFGVEVLYNLSFNPTSMSDILWNYDRKYRLVGFTGYALGFSGLKLVGPTSVQMGVYLALIALIFATVYNATKKKFHLIGFVIVLIGEFLTQSRSGLAVLFLGLALIYLENFKIRRINIYLFLIIVVLTPILFSSAGAVFLKSFGTIAKMFDSAGFQDGSTGARVEILKTLGDYYNDHPWDILWGTGYGEIYTMAKIQLPHLEGLIVTALFQSGILAVLILLLYFFLIWYRMRLISTAFGKTDFLGSIAYGIKMFAPGYFAVNIMSGNSLQTDFIAPFLFFMIAYLELKYKTIRGDTI